MARGGKVSRSHGRIQRSEKDGASDDDSSDEEAQAPGAARAKLGGQPATAGMMPPSDSDEDEYEEEEEEKPKAKPKPAGKSGQPATAGKLPPTSDSDEEDEDEEEDDDDEDDDEDDKAQPAVARGGAPAPERTAKEIAQDLARLELIRKQRADAAAERIAREGFDRFAPK